MTSTERAVRKASGERLRREMRQAARLVRLYQFAYGPVWGAAERMLTVAAVERSRTRYACIMTAFGQ